MDMNKTNTQAQQPPFPPIPHTTYGLTPTLCPDGKYRWVYEVNLYKNPTMFYDLLKVTGICGGLVLLFIMAVDVMNGDYNEIAASAGVGLGIMVFLLLMSLVGYFIWAGMNGGSYVALMVMDEQSVTHRQMPKQVKRDQVLGAIGAMTGAAMDEMSLAASSLLAASVNSWTSQFSSVRLIKAKPRRHLIMVNERLTKNRIYVGPESYDWVLQHIATRCPKAKIEQNYAIK